MYRDARKEARKYYEQKEIIMKKKKNREAIEEANDWTVTIGVPDLFRALASACVILGPFDLKFFNSLKYFFRASLTHTRSHTHIVVLCARSVHFVVVCDQEPHLVYGLGFRV